MDLPLKELFLFLKFEPHLYHFKAPNLLYSLILRTWRTKIIRDVKRWGELKYRRICNRLLLSINLWIFCLVVIERRFFFMLIGNKCRLMTEFFLLHCCSFWFQWPKWNLVSKVVRIRRWSKSQWCRLTWVIHGEKMLSSISCYCSLISRHLFPWYSSLDCGIITKIYIGHMLLNWSIINILNWLFSITILNTAIFYSLI